MKIKLTIGSDEYSATLNSSKAATDFLALLPTTLMLKDYAGTEKICDLPVRLNKAESPEGVAATIRDIAYYAPWGNLAVFYRDSGLLPVLSN